MNLQNAQCKPRGAGGKGGEESAGRRENVGHFFLEWERRINLTNVAKNPSQGQNTN